MFVNEKAELRKIAKEKNLKVLNPEAKSLQISKILNEFLGNAKNVILYSADSLEVNLESLFILNTNRNYFFPKIISIPDRTLEFVKPLDWKMGPYKILEPVGEDKISPLEADFSVIPALGWNSSGFRLGRGGGFYDRAFQSVFSLQMIGVCYFENFPFAFYPDPHDICVGTILSEQGRIFSRLPV